MFLLYQKVIFDFPFQSGYSPLLIACEYQKAEAVKFLLELPNINVSVCAEHVSDGDDEEVKGKSALHIAAIHDSAEIAEMLIEKGCPLLVQDLEVSGTKLKLN